MKSKTRQSTRFGVCINNAGYPASIEVGKLYAVIPDAEAAKHGYIRVIDESGEDYGYAAERFFLLDVPEVLARTLSASRKLAERPNRLLRRTAASRRRLKA